MIQFLSQCRAAFILLAVFVLAHLSTFAVSELPYFCFSKPAWLHARAAFGKYRAVSHNFILQVSMLDMNTSDHYPLGWLSTASGWGGVAEPRLLRGFVALLLSDFDVWLLCSGSQ